MTTEEMTQLINELAVLSPDHVDRLGELEEHITTLTDATDVLIQENKQLTDIETKQKEKRLQDFLKRGQSKIETDVSDEDLMASLTKGIMENGD